MNIKIQDLEEDFLKAYKSRMNDFLYLQEKKDDHKILIMHLGGIIIECYLKHLIVKKHDIKKHYFYENQDVKKIIWCSEQTALILNNNNNDNKILVENPKHNLMKAIKQLPELDKTMSAKKDIRLKLINIQDPLNKRKPTYIDLRYMENDIFDEKEKFEKWMDDFKYILNWIKINSKDIYRD